MSFAPQVVLFDADSPRAAALYERLRQRGIASELRGLSPESELAADLAVIAVAPEAAAHNAELEKLLQRLVESRVPTMVCGDAPELRAAGGPLVEWVHPSVSLDEVAGKVGTLARYAPLLRGLERELQHLHRLGEQLNRHFGEIDQEMRLAGRLQHDFLPRELPQVPPYRFEVFYRPASWVSGDMYDAFRIDEHHVGLFVADAMGHGVAAGLLTMFLRQALVAKRVAGSAYTIVRPAEALENLHQCLLRQHLPNSQFVTAAYGILDTRTAELTFARAGHPYPLHVHAGGGPIDEIRSGGSLLGLADVPAEFEETRVRLAPSEKIVLYTDGIEDVLVVPSGQRADGPTFTTQLVQWAALPAADFLQAVAEHLDRREGSLHPADDITLLVLEAGPGH